LSDASFQKIVLVGNTTFQGCVDICGDKIILTPETCDDGNSALGDGCSETCKVEDGWVCGTAGYACCKILASATNAGESNINTNLECFNGFWSTHTTDMNVPAGLNGTIRVAEDTRICGNFVVQDHLIVDGVLLEVAGAIGASASGGTIELTNGGRISIIPPCWTTTKRAEFTVPVAGTLIISNFTWETGDPAPDTPFTIDGCADVGGSLVFLAEEIPTGSNDFTLIQSSSSCMSYSYSEDDVFENIEMDLPDGCSNLEAHGLADQVVITLNRKHLCPAQVGGIAVGCVGVTAVVAGGAYAASGGLAGLGGAADDAYVLL